MHACRLRQDRQPTWRFSVAIFPSLGLPAAPAGPEVMGSSRASSSCVSGMLLVPASAPGSATGGKQGPFASEEAPLQVAQPQQQGTAALKQSCIAGAYAPVQAGTSLVLDSSRAETSTWLRSRPGRCGRFWGAWRCCPGSGACGPCQGFRGLRPPPACCCHRYCHACLCCHRLQTTSSQVSTGSSRLQFSRLTHDASFGGLVVMGNAFREATFPLQRQWKTMCGNSGTALVDPRPFCHLQVLPCQ